MKSGLRENEVLSLCLSTQIHSLNCHARLTHSNQYGGGGGGGGGGGLFIVSVYITTFYSFARSLLSAVHCMTIRIVLSWLEQINYFGSGLRGLSPPCPLSNYGTNRPTNYTTGGGGGGGGGICIPKSSPKGERGEGSDCLDHPGSAPCH